MGGYHISTKCLDNYWYVNWLYMISINNIVQCHRMLGFDLRNLLKTGDRLSTQLAKIDGYCSDLIVVELTADVVTIFLINTAY